MNINHIPSNQDYSDNSQEKKYQISLETLPLEIKHLILFHLGLNKDLAKVGSINHGFQEIYKTPIFQDKLIEKTIVRFREINCLSVEILMQLPEDYRYRAPSLKLKSSHLTKSLKSLIKAYPNLQIIYLSSSKISDRELKSLTKLKELNYLNLKLCKRITHTGLKSLTKLTKLQRLDLSGFIGIKDKNHRKALISLSKFNHLQNFSLRNISNLSNSELKWLTTTLTNLHKLEISSNITTDKEFKSLLATLTNLQKLEVNSANIIRDKAITDNGLKSLATLTNLYKLKLRHNWNITDEGLKSSITTLTNLQWLLLSGYLRITDEGLKSLTALTNLHTLYLFCLKIKDAGLKSLTTLTNLHTLYLFSCPKITDAGLKSLNCKICHLNYKSVLNMDGLW